MKGPVPERVYREMTIERTGDIAMTTPGRCYCCNDRVNGEPLMKWSFPDLDAHISLWMCEGCYYEALDAEQGWNDAQNNVSND